MIRYEEVDEQVLKKLADVQLRHFPELKNAKIAVLFDLKKASKERTAREIAKKTLEVKHG